MLAARMHEIGGSLLLEQIPLPEPCPTDVLIAVKVNPVQSRKVPVEASHRALEKQRIWLGAVFYPATFGLHAMGLGSL
jgi:hypothetical protein